MCSLTDCVHRDHQHTPSENYFSYLVPCFITKVCYIEKPTKVFLNYLNKRCTQLTWIDIDIKWSSQLTEILAQNEDTVIVKKKKI